ncbi:MAG: sulfotransferase [Parvularculaceae bacterium]
MPLTLSIIGAGFGRTGTAARKIALETLGVGPCRHLVPSCTDRNRSMQRRQARLRAGAYAPHARMSPHPRTLA